MEGLVDFLEWQSLGKPLLEVGELGELISNVWRGVDLKSRLVVDERIHVNPLLLKLRLGSTTFSYHEYFMVFVTTIQPVFSCILMVMEDLH